MITMKRSKGRPLSVQIGDRYGMLTVVARVQNGPRRQVRYLCACDCGNQLEVVAASLRTGKTRSCGCLRRARMRAAANAAAAVTQFMVDGKYEDNTEFRH